MVLRKSFYIRWSAGRSPRVHEVNPGRDPSLTLFGKLRLCSLLCLILCNIFVCITGIEIVQVDYKESVHQLSKAVKSVYTVIKWILYLKNNKVSKVLQ